MKTDWDLIRSLMNTIIDACEHAENLQVTDEERAASAEVNGQRVTVQDFLRSAWTYPENAKDKVIIARAQAGNAKPYTSELSRALCESAKVCAELVGARTEHGQPDAAADEARSMIRWYRSHFMPGLTSAVLNKRR